MAVSPLADRKPKTLIPLSIGFPIIVLFAISLFFVFNRLLLGESSLPTYLGLFPLLAAIGIALKASWGVSLARLIVVVGYIGSFGTLIQLHVSTQPPAEHIIAICAVLLGVGILTLVGGLLSSRSAKAYLDRASRR